jgi:hypothetical protein
MFEIVESVCSLKLKMKTLVFVYFGGFAIGGLSALVNDWIFSPPSSFYALIGLIVADHATGITLAWKRNRFETRKATRIFWTVLSHTALLLFATNLSNGSAALFWLNEGVFVPLVIVNLLSLVKNLSLLGWIKRGVAEFFYRKIDTYKNEFVAKNENEN